MSKVKFRGVCLMPLLCVGFFPQVANISWAQQLSSIEEIESKYARGYVTDSVQDIECFWGCRKRLKPTFQLEREYHIFKFNKKTLEVSAVLSEEQSQKFSSRFGGNVLGLSLSPKGDALAVNASPQYSKGMPVDIVLIEMASGQTEPLVADGWNNSPMRFSPDGEYLAYYSTDARAVTNTNELLPVGAGRVMNVQTKEVITFVEPFMITSDWTIDFLPAWLDNNRVLFAAMSTDSEFIRAKVTDTEECAEYLGIKYCPYVALADLSTGKVTRFFVLGGHCPPYFAVDRTKSRIYINDTTNRRKPQIIRVDFNLENPKVVFEGVPTHMKMENGVLQFTAGGQIHRITD